MRIVHDDRQLEGPQPVGAHQNEIADLALDVLLLHADAAIEPLHGTLGGAKAPGARRPAVQARAAGAGVDQFRMALVRAAERRQCPFDVLARTGARIREPEVHQAIERLPI